MISIFNLLGPRKKVETLDHFVGGLDGPPVGRMRLRANVDIDCNIDESGVMRSTRSISEQSLFSSSSIY